MLSEDGLKKFIDLYEKKYFVKLKKQEAFNMFSKLVNIVRLANIHNPPLK